MKKYRPAPPHTSVPRVGASAQPAATICLTIPQDFPDNLIAYREWVLRLANQILDAIPNERDGYRELEQLVALVNDLPTRYRVISKLDPVAETWSFDVVYRQAAARPLPN